MIFKIGMIGVGVKTRQQWLKEHGYYHAKVDGDFGPLTEQAVKLFEKDARIKVDGMIGPDNEKAMKRWKLIVARNNVIDRIALVRTKEIWPGIAVHYAAAEYTSKTLSPPEVINQWHQARGFIKGGYHYLIQGNTLYKGDDYPNLLRRSNEIGAHAKGFNSKYLGVCVFTKDKPTKIEYEVLTEALTDMRKQGNGHKHGIKGHQELPYATACPGPIDMDYVRKETS